MMMSISIEALAMVGVDHVEWGMNVEEWEREDSELKPPPHLLAEEEEEEAEKKEEEETSKDDGVECSNVGDDTKVSQEERLLTVGSIRNWLNFLKIIKKREMDVKVLSSTTYDHRVH
ncbi:hypothetical protein Patl1_12403 [Pistacia atlantica]|uniref:Uncharacterized protein n=1 Tax=Pistacia atlantica TaxID=434234 RepID=A0ACC1A678_9ROSI|nr:hypothetical protein Patl1_12403 [Pistacia atlantica]